MWIWDEGGTFWELSQTSTGGRFWDRLRWKVLGYIEGVTFWEGKCVAWIDHRERGGDRWKGLGNNKSFDGS